MYMYIQSTIHLYKRALCNFIYFSLPSVLSYAHACVVTVRNRHVHTLRYVCLSVAACARHVYTYGIRIRYAIPL